jgi:hypothetical protein
MEKYEHITRKWATSGKKEMLQLLHSAMPLYPEFTIAHKPMHNATLDTCFYGKMA